MSRKIKLYGIYGNGKYAIIDDADYNKVSQHRWRCDYRNYVLTSKHGVLIYLHRFILDTPSNLLTDHINGDKLDNRRINLRICTNSQNQANTGTWNGHPTRGVYFSHGKWMVRLSYKGNRLYFGRFKDKVDAITIFNLKYRELFGEFAKENING